MVATTEKVMEILDREVSLMESIDNNASLRKDAELDSLDLSVFLLALQEEYGVPIPDEDADQLDSVVAIVDWLNNSIS